jgi:hypothetical protein
VSSSIQPTSAPSGTDDDKVGNDNVRVLAGTNLQDCRRAAELMLKTGRMLTFYDILVIYDISPPGIHLR